MSCLADIRLLHRCIRLVEGFPTRPRSSSADNIQLVVAPADQGWGGVWGQQGGVGVGVLLLRWRSSVVPRGTRRPLAGVCWSGPTPGSIRSSPEPPVGACGLRQPSPWRAAVPGQQQQRLVGVATAAAAVTGRCGSSAAAICARWLRRLGAQRPRCLRGTADSVGAIGGSIAPRRAGRPAAREGSSNRGSRKFAGNRRERGCERPVGVEVVAGGALNCTWRPQGGRAASPRPRGTQAALSRQLAGPK